MALPVVAAALRSGVGRFLISPKRFPRLPKNLFKPPPGFKKPKVKDFKDDMERLGEDIAEEFKELIVENIKRNKYGYRLASSTIRKKRRKGQPDIPLIADKYLVNAIYRDGVKVSVKDSGRRDSKLTNLELAIVHEYGRLDGSIPARPVWRRTYRDFRKSARNRMTDFFKNPKFKKQ